MSLDTPTRQTALRVLTAYGVQSAALEILTGGLINLSLAVTASSGTQWVLQRLNPIFPPEVNLNLDLVTRHLFTHGQTTPRLERTTSGELWVSDDIYCWRLLSFVPGASYATVPDLAHAENAGRILGRFHRMLASLQQPLPLQRLPVHEPARHFRHLANALAAHPAHPRIIEVVQLATRIFMRSRELPVPIFQPQRLLHGDPKLSNLRFGHTLDASCMLDLDTITTATLAYELGDAFRSWCNPHAEDAAHADFDLGLFKSAIEGYALEAREFIQQGEIDAIVDATEMIYLELAARFAADALNDAYFGWDATRFGSRTDHNLRRASNQIAAAAALRQQRAVAQQYVAAAFSV